MKSGFVAIVGRPNVGKSTLLNAFLGQKIVITSARPQTTRNRILGILTDEDCQIVFHDTPGVHKARDPMNQFMMAEVERAFEGVDLVIVLLDLNEGIGRGDRYIIDWVGPMPVTKFLAFNKIDLVETAAVKSAVDEIVALDVFKGVFAVSALKKMGTASLLEAVKNELPEGPLYYDGDIVTDRPERFIISELVREQIFEMFREEVPYSTAVIIEEMKEREKGKPFVRATILVERDSQKGVLIGKGGRSLREVGEQSRHQIRETLGYDVYLELFVKVRKNWRKDEQILKDLGYS